ncbi:MAG: transporter substrate-binding domain-containing protein, partial [Paucibacter sp.]|nr:transporter substrate-binding domain-containing protein [Roseateles sp.]
LAGRGRFFIYRSPGLKTLVRKAGLEAKVRVLPAVIYTTPLYLVVSRQLSPALIQELTRTVAELDRSGEFARIYERWSD